MNALEKLHLSRSHMSFLGIAKPALEVARRFQTRQTRANLQLALFAPTSQPVDTGVVEPPVNEELQGMNLVGVNDAFCHLSSGPKNSARAGVVFPVSASGLFTSKSTTSFTTVVFPVPSVRVYVRVPTA